MERDRERLRREEEQADPDETDRGRRAQTNTALSSKCRWRGAGNCRAKAKRIVGGMSSACVHPMAAGEAMHRRVRWWLQQRHWISRSSSADKEDKMVVVKKHTV
jgi:hypothetical protein